VFMARVLIVDDDPGVSRLLASIVSGLGHEERCTATLRDGFKEVLTGAYDVILLDLRLPDGNALDLLPQIRSRPGAPEVIVITGMGGPEVAELALRNGAWDYIEKPASKEEMTLPLLRALEYHREKQTARQPLVLKHEGIVGKSPAIRACLELLAQAAASDAPVILSGETGTGKEIFARTIHVNSGRAAGQFVVVDCAAMPGTLAESILFGHEKGAFTGAHQAQVGLVQQAHGGTLFLDEVGELSKAMQKVFLRVLQERRFRPLGSKKEIFSNFRIIAATNRNLPALVQEGRFRADLLFRLQAVVIDLPPLREHTQDIKSLVLHYLESLGSRYGWGVKGFTPEFLEALESYDWPGNVRELVNTLERALVAAQGEPTLYPQHLPLPLRLHFARGALREGGAKTSGSPLEEDGFPTWRQFHEAMSLEYLRIVLNRSGGDLKKARTLAGLSRSRFYNLLRKHSLLN
jgi:two-component system, NtrC family, response regulator